MQARLLRNVSSSDVQKFSEEAAGKTLVLRDGLLQLFSVSVLISRLVGRRMFWPDLSDMSNAYVCAWSKLSRAGMPEQFLGSENCIPAGHLDQNRDEPALLASPFCSKVKPDNKSGLS